MLSWSCHACSVNEAVKVSVGFAESHSFTHELQWSVESSASFGPGTGPHGQAQNSSLRATVQPSSGDLSFRGLAPTVVHVVARPSLYTDQTTGKRASGYHLEYVSTSLGHQVSEQSFQDHNGVRLLLSIEQAPATLATTRLVHQSIFVFVSNSFGAILGLLGIASFLMGKVEGWWIAQRPFESLDRVDIMVADWMRQGAPRIFEQLNAKYINTSKAEEKFLAVRARCLNSDIFAVFNQFDLLHKGYLDRDEFGEFMEELDIVLSDAEREQVEEFFADGKVEFGEFKDFYLDHTQRTIQQRRSTISERLESTPRGRAAKKKFQSKVRSLSAVRMLATSSSPGSPRSDRGERGTAEQIQSGVKVEILGHEVLAGDDAKEYTAYRLQCACRQRLLGATRF